MAYDVNLFDQVAAVARFQQVPCSDLAGELREKLFRLMAGGR
jgi:hypothetical protein